MKRIHPFLIILITLISPPCFAGDPSIVLYQPNEVLVQRIGNDVTPLADYIKKIQSVATPLLQKEKPEVFDIVIIVKPDADTPKVRSRVWLVSNLTDNPSNDALKTQLEAIQPPEVKSGPLAIALSYLLNGATKSTTSANFQPPIPEEWKRKIPIDSKTPIIPDGIMPYIWPDKE